MAKINTMVTSRTFDVEEKVMYPDRETKERTLDDVARLLTTGHTVEWRDGNRVIVLTVDKFNKILLPRFPEHSSLNIAVEEENTVITGRTAPVEATIEDAISHTGNIPVTGATTTVMPEPTPEVKVEEAKKEETPKEGKVEETKKEDKIVPPVNNKNKK